LIHILHEPTVQIRPLPDPKSFLSRFVRGSADQFAQEMVLKLLRLSEFDSLERILSPFIENRLTGVSHSHELHLISNQLFSVSRNRGLFQGRDERRFIFLFVEGNYFLYIFG